MLSIVRELMLSQFSQQRACQQDIPIREKHTAKLSSALFPITEALLAHLLTTGPSATCTNCPSDSFRPCHLRDRFFLSVEGEDLSPPPPIHRRPSAVVAAVRPLGEIDVDMMNGGESETPDDGGVVAEDE